MSHFPQTPDEAGYTVVRCNTDEALLRNEDGGLELFYRADEYPGWCITICGMDFEYARDIPETVRC